MTVDVLEKANKLKAQIDFIELQIARLNFTQSKNVVESKSYFEFDGCESFGQITITTN